MLFISGNVYYLLLLFLVIQTSPVHNGGLSKISKNLKSQRIFPNTYTKGDQEYEKKWYTSLVSKL